MLLLFYLYPLALPEYINACWLSIWLFGFKKRKEKDLVVQVAQIDVPAGISTFYPVLTVCPANNDITWTGFNF